MKTAGEILAAARREKGWSISELSRRTKIQERFLSALEASRVEKLPDAPFVLGFVRTAAGELGLDPAGMAAIFRRDFGVRRGKVIPRGMKRDSQRGVRWSPAGTVIAGVGIVALAFGAYLVFQLKILVGSPQMTVTAPQENAVVEPNVLIEGTGDPAAAVTINGQEITKHRDGTFSRTILLTEGVHTITIAAIGQNGKTTTVQRTVQVKIP